MAQNNQLTGGSDQSSPGRLNGIFENTLEGDFYNAIGSFYYSKSYAGNGKVNMSILDRYDYERGGSSPGGILIGYMVTAQEIGIITPFYTKIDVKVTGTVPLSWEYTSTGITITGAQNNISQIEIPSKLYDLRVRALQLPSVEVTSIGNNAFLGCTQLTKISIPASITSIGQNAFANCPNLTTINIPDGRLINITGHVEVYTMAGNAPIYVTSWDNIGGETERMAVSSDFFNLLRQYPMDGTFVKDHFGDTYIFAGGAPLYVTYWGNVGGERWHPLVDGMALRTYADTGKFSHVRQYPMDGTFVKDHFGDTYIFAGGAPLYVTYWGNVGGERWHPLVDGMALRTYADTGKFSHVREKPLDGTFVSTIHGNNYRYIGGVAYLYSYWSIDPPYTLVDAASL